MKTPAFSQGEKNMLALLAAFAFLVPNGIFVYCLFFDREAVAEAILNPVSAVFILEAMFLMLLFAWLIRKAGAAVGAQMFVILSLVGSLAFSVPAALYLEFRKKQGED